MHAGNDPVPEPDPLLAQADHEFTKGNLHAVAEGQRPRGNSAANLLTSQTHEAP